MQPPDHRSLAPPTWMPEQKGGSLRVSTGYALLPLSLGFLLLLVYVFRAPMALVVTFAIGVPMLYLASAVYVHRGLPRFDAEFNRLLQAGDLRGLRTHLSNARLLRLLAPGDYMLGRRGVLLQLHGEHEASEQLLEEAWETAPKRRRMMLIGPLSRAKFELGRWRELRELSEQWRVRSLFPGAANLYLAAACLRDTPADPARARELLEEASGTLGTSERKLHARLLAEVKASEAKA